MRQNIIIGSLIGAAFIILKQFEFFHALLLFLLIGALPGTTYTVPSSAMLILTLGLISFVAGYIARHQTLRP